MCVYCHMSDFNLALCYEALFFDFPRGSLEQFRLFCDDHDTRNIVTLADFAPHFAQVCHAFEQHNFAVEYVRNYGTTAGFNPHHPTTAQCIVKLQTLRNAISALTASRGCRTGAPHNSRDTCSIRF